MTYQLGIDVGTTYTAAAVCRSSGRGWGEPEVIGLGTRSATVPSVLYLADDGSVLVGEVAERRAVTEPDRVVREFKRRIGDLTPIVVAGTTVAPEELSARLVRWVVDRVAEREGGPAEGIAIAHPASWGAHKKDLFAAALAEQGLAVTFLAEPEAAALHYAASERVGPGSTIAVYDLGGGTFDAAVVHKNEQGVPAFGLLGRAEGLERLGGIDFDQAVFDHVRDGVPDAFDELDDTDPAVLSAMARIRRECAEAKEALSSDTEVTIPVLLPGSRGSVRLHRSEFEALIRPQVEETVTALRRAVVSAGLEPEQLTAVLLVGGSSRIPLVAQLVSEQLGRPVAVDADPKNAIAKGAALAISPEAVAEPSTPTAGFPAPFLADAPPRPPLGGAESVRISHEPAAHFFSGSDSGMNEPAAWRTQPEWQHGPFDGRGPHGEADDRPARPVGLLIGVGGALAAAALVAGVLVWESATPTRTAVITPSDVGVGASATPLPTSAPPTTEQVEPTQAVQKPSTSSGGSTRAKPQVTPKQNPKQSSGEPPVIPKTTSAPPPPVASSAAPTAAPAPAPPASGPGQGSVPPSSGPSGDTGGDHVGGATGPPPNGADTAPGSLPGGAGSVSPGGPSSGAAGSTAVPPTGGVAA